MDIKHLQGILEDYVIKRITFTDRRGRVHEYKSDASLQHIIADCKIFHRSQLPFFNIWCEGYLIPVTIHPYDDLTYGIYDYRKGNNDVDQNKQ